jgi:glycosyltransferase involved in cell wall biosynthesis
MFKNPQISIVIPLYNEEKVFEPLISRVSKVVLNSNLNCEVILIDDGSNDATPMLMEELALENSIFNCIFLSKNFGHQIALSAGLSCARASEAVFIIDGDLQDPPELLIQFFEKYKEGFDVVYAIRQKRKENRLKRIAYFIFYRLLDRITDIKIPIDSGDFGMMSRRVVDKINSMPEHSRYLRGMRSWIGFKQIGIPYERDERQEGETKYSFKLLVKLAKEGIFNFSEFPIIFITRLGLISLSISLIYFFNVLYKRIVFGTVPEGFTALLLAIILFSGVILISLGVIGEYILRIFKESSNRPLFIIDKQILNGEKVTDQN